MAFLRPYPVFDITIRELYRSLTIDGTQKNTSINEQLQWITEFKEDYVTIIDKNLILIKNYGDDTLGSLSDKNLAQMCRSDA